MSRATVGIIGGTGLGELVVREGRGRSVALTTPFGPPSGDLVLAEWEGVDVAFLSRHGSGHSLSPSTVPYRANVWALKQLGVSVILASGATGSLREGIKPGDLVLCDQVIDRTYRRAGTFFDEGLVAHVEFAEPFCPRLRELLLEAGRHLDTTVHPRGTYVCMEGPQFSTRAESQMHRAWGGDLIGMTCMPEAKLAREAEICYALVALPTDYDCWRPADTTHTGEALLQEIIGNLQRASHNAVNLLREALRRMGGTDASCRCQDALKLAIWSDRAHVDPTVRERLGLLVGRYLGETNGCGPQ